MTRSAIAIVALLSGCAPALPNVPSSTHAGHLTSADLNDNRMTHPEPDLTCRDEIPTGSNLERRKCRSDMERRMDRDAMEHTFLNPSQRR